MISRIFVSKVFLVYNYICLKCIYKCHPVASTFRKEMVHIRNKSAGSYQQAVHAELVCRQLARVCGLLDSFCKEFEMGLLAGGFKL